MTKLQRLAHGVMYVMRAHVNSTGEEFPLTFFVLKPNDEVLMMSAPDKGDTAVKGLIAAIQAFEAVGYVIGSEAHFLAIAAEDEEEAMRKIGQGGASQHPDAQLCLMVHAESCTEALDGIARLTRDGKNDLLSMDETLWHDTSTGAGGQFAGLIGLRPILLPGGKEALIKIAERAFSTMRLEDFVVPE